MVRPYCQSCSKFWSPPYKEDFKVLECVQRATKLVKVLQKISERLRELGLFSLERKNLRASLVYNNLKGCSSKGGTVCFPRNKQEQQNRGNSHERFRLNVRKNFIVERIVRHWKSLLKEVFKPLPIDVFKRPVALRDTVQWWAWQC